MESKWLAGKASAFFVFREHDGRLRCLSWKRWMIPETEVIAWAKNREEGMAIVAELRRKESETLFAQNEI